MISSLEIHGLVQTLAARLLDSVVVGTLLAVSAAILLRAFRQRGPATRFAVLFATLMCIGGLLWFDGWTLTGYGTPASSLITIPAAWALYLLCAWAIISGTALVRVGLGLWQLQRIRSSCTAVEGSELDPLLREALRSMQGIRRVELCTSDRVNVPTVLGLVRPAVVLPAWAMTELSPVELHAVVLHELAHLRRWDDWTNLAQKLVRALLFFHPAVWWIESRLTLEREMACDDAVLDETTNPREYAQCLVSMAEKGFLRRSLALAQAIVGRVRQMSARIARILDNHRDGHRPETREVWKPAVGFVGVLSVACLVWSPRASRLIGFVTPMQAPVAVATQVKAPGGSCPRVVEASWKASESTGAIRPQHYANQASFSKRRPEKKVPDSGLVLRARTSHQAQVLQPMQALFVVMESQHVAADGAVLWSVRVVRFTVWHSSISTDNQQVPRKI